MQIWSLAEDLMLDKAELDLSITPQAILNDLSEGLTLKALLSSLSLGEASLCKAVIEGIEGKEIGILVPLISFKYLPPLLTVINRLLKNGGAVYDGAAATSNVKVELLLCWIKEILFSNGRQARQPHGRSKLSASLKDILSTLSSLYAPLSQLANENIFIMRGILDDC